MPDFSGHPYGPPSNRYGRPLPMKPPWIEVIDANDIHRFLNPEHISRIDIYEEERVWKICFYMINGGPTMTHATLIQGGNIDAAIQVARWKGWLA